MKIRKFDKTDALLSVSYAIEKICEENKITCSDFARKIGSAPSTVSVYMCQKCLPSIDVLMNISAEFNVSVDWILGLSQKR